MTADTVNPYAVVEGVEIATLRMLPKHVLVRWLKKVESKGGVLMPQNRQRRSYMKGEILSIGPDCSHHLEVGQTIQFESLADKEFLGVQDPADRDSVFAMREEDIHGILETHENGFTSFFPLNDYILLKPDQGMDEVGGVLMPEHLRKGSGMTWFGRVVCISPEVVESPQWNLASPADHVAYDTQCAQEVIINGETMVVVRAAYILAVLNDVKRNVEVPCGAD